MLWITMNIQLEVIQANLETEHGIRKMIDFFVELFGIFSLIEVLYPQQG